MKERRERPTQTGLLGRTVDLVVLNDVPVDLRIRVLRDGLSGDLDAFVAAMRRRRHDAP